MKTPALLDGKDLCPEFGWLFDDEKSVTQGSHELGFIYEIPCVTSYFRNALQVKCLLNRWHLNVNVGVKLRIAETCKYADYYAESSEPDAEGRILIQFFWKEKTL